MRASCVVHCFLRLHSILNTGFGVGVFSNAGNGTFLSQITYTTGLNPYALAVGDLDSDNRPDIVTVNSGTNTTSILLHC